MKEIGKTSGVARLEGKKRGQADSQRERIYKIDPPKGIKLLKK